MAKTILKKKKKVIKITELQPPALAMVTHHAPMEKNNSFHCFETKFHLQDSSALYRSRISIGSVDVRISNADMSFIIVAKRRDLLFNVNKDIT